jgi:EmrB/QacA subfamily drug resistance transporter
MSESNSPSQTNDAPKTQFTHRQILTVLGGLMMGMFLAALDMTVVGTAIRTIADDLQGFELQAWATTAFLITSTIVTPLYGKLSDIYGRRPFYLLAITLFIIGSALCGLAQDMYQLAGARAFQGLGAGGLMSLALAIIGDLVPPRERARYQGYFMAVFGTSSVLGPVVGGALAGTETFLGFSGWRWIFLMNVPIGLVALAVVYKVLHLPHTRREHRIDWWGAAALILCLVPTLTVVEQGREWGWSSLQAIAFLAVGAVALLAFIYIERGMKDDALLPLTLFKNRTFAIGTSASLVVGIGMFGALAMLPLYLQIVRDATPTSAGLQMLPLTLGIMSGALTSGKLIGRTGKYKVFPVTGAVLMIVALASLSFIGSNTEITFIMSMMVIFGLGLGFNMQPVILAVQNALSARNMGIATSSVTFFRQMGGAIGTAVFLSVLFATLPGNIGGEIQVAQTTPVFQQATQANPDQAAALEGNSATALDDTSFIANLDPAIAAPIKDGFSDSVHTVFLIGSIVMVLGALLLAFLPELPLRSQGGIQARDEDDKVRLEEPEPTPVG